MTDTKNWSYHDYVASLRRAMAYPKETLPDIPAAEIAEDDLLKKGVEVVSIRLPWQMQVLFWESYIVRRDSANKTGSQEVLQMKSIALSDLICEVMISEIKNNKRFSDLVGDTRLTFVIGRNWEAHFYKKEKQKL